LPSATISTSPAALWALLAPSPGPTPRTRHSLPVVWSPHLNLVSSPPVAPIEVILADGLRVAVAPGFDPPNNGVPEASAEVVEGRRSPAGSKMQAAASRTQIRIGAGGRPQGRSLPRPEASHAGRIHRPPARPARMPAGCSAHPAPCR